jgi:hypothetical protein
MAMLAAIGFAGCRAPQSVRIEQESASPKRCHDYNMPSDWVSWQSSSPSQHRHANRFGYELRRTGSQYLIRGTYRDEQGVLTLSPDLFFLARQGQVRPATEADWQAASPVEPLRKEAATEASTEPSEEVLTRVSPDGKRLLRIQHQRQEGLLSHRAVATLTLHDVPSGKQLWSGSGAAPQLPPIEQFQQIAWIDDSTVLWPRNAAATRFTICWDLGR